MAVTQEDMEFSTSHWCRRAPQQDIFPMHLKFIKEESDKNRKLISCHLNIKYGNGKRTKYDIYGADLEDDAPIYIHIHGGYWQQLDKDMSCYMAKPLHDNEYKAIVVGYDLCPDVTLPQIMVQIETAVTQIMAYASRLGTRAIYMGGHSAGAHLISSLFHNLIPSLPPAQRALIKEIFLISGIYDLTPLVTTNVNKVLNLDVATARACSPMFQEFNVDRHVVVNVLVGEHDPPKFIEQCTEFCDKLRAGGVQVGMKVLGDYDHFNIVERLSEEDYEVTKMILKKGKCDGNDPW